MRRSPRTENSAAALVRVQRAFRRSPAWLLGLLLASGVALTGAQISRADSATCEMCHSDPSTFEDYGARAKLLVVTDRSLVGSVHAGFQCVDCHADLAGAHDFPHAEKLAPVNCGACHDDVAAEFAQSWHAQIAAKREGAVPAPTCASCHGTHDIRPASDPLSMVSPANLPRTCASCHSRIAREAGNGVRRIDAYALYERGIHAKRISEGILSAASCIDCHGYHDLRKASDPKSPVYKYNIPKTCGKCHTEVYAKYERGIHGKALAAGVTDAPNCVDCHGEHQIQAPWGPDAPDNAANLTDFACAKCHNDPRLVAKYGLKGERISSYQDSYHGMARERGSTKAASCASCHEAHAILPPDDPASSISPGRIVETCKKCHPTANAKFASAYSHEAILGKPNTVKGIIGLIYIPLIILVIGGMAAHNGLIILHYIRKKRAAEEAGESYERLSRTMVIQHATFGTSFIVLAITGFALRFPEAWWARALASVGLTESLRGIVHRVAACLMIGVSVHHVFFVSLSRRGRTEFYHIIPGLIDVKQAWQNIRYYLGWTEIKPDFDRYDYTEKAEYWALAWGTTVMAATGFVLWFPEAFTKWLPGWIVIASETIHYYEAWLAILAIIVWHLFFVIFHPEEYPMNLTWMKGRISERRLKEKHPAWYRRLRAEKSAAAQDTRGDLTPGSPDDREDSQG
jgi:cytochrome b subunit of formate dehydrogenase/nitrate/TMAO reductase-like tetraheme cytochrome c subunit